MKATLKYVPLVLLLMSPTWLTGQDEEVEDLPKVFMIGEHEDRYGELYEEYHDILLSVSNNDMNTAFDRWMHMLKEMEEYSKSIDFDLNGVKVWLKLFWAEEGNIDHLSFFLKPDSRNIDTTELAAFFSSFMNHYQMPIEASVKFTHNGSAQFPTAIPSPLSRK